MELNHMSLNSKKPFQWRRKSNEKGEVIPVGNHIQMIMTKAIHSRASGHSGRYSWSEDLSKQLKSAMKDLKVVCLVVYLCNDAFGSSTKKKYVSKPIIVINFKIHTDLSKMHCITECLSKQLTQLVDNKYKLTTEDKANLKKSTIRTCSLSEQTGGLWVV